MYTPGETFELPNIAYERLCLLLNLTALLCRIAADEDRSSMEGIKRAAGGFAVRHIVLGHLHRALIHVTP